MENKPEESNISENKNLTKLDDELEQAIEEANTVFRNLAESILNVYNLARGKGYEPFEARKIVETRIINVTPQYIRRILPEEAKHLEKRKITNMRKKVSHTENKPSESGQIDDKNVIEQSNKQGSDDIEPDEFDALVLGSTPMAPLTDEEIDKVANEPYKLKPGQEQEETPLIEGVKELLDKDWSTPAIRRGNPEEIAFIPQTNRVAMEPDTKDALIEKQAAKINELIRALREREENEGQTSHLLALRAGAAMSSEETLKIQNENKRLREENEGLEEDVRMLREERSRFKGAIATKDEAAPFHVIFPFKIGTIRLNLDLLIDPVEKKVLEHTRVKE